MREKGVNAKIGMILVDEQCRGLGLGKRTFEAALQAAKESGCEVLGLDATNMGELEPTFWSLTACWWGRIA